MVQVQRPTLQKEKKRSLDLVVWVSQNSQAMHDTVLAGPSAFLLIFLATESQSIVQTSLELSFCVTQADLKFKILLPQPSKC